MSTIRASPLARVPIPADVILLGAVVLSIIVLALVVDHRRTPTDPARAATVTDPSADAVVMSRTLNAPPQIY